MPDMKKFPLAPHKMDDGQIEVCDPLIEVNL
jgi:hypothetical protein